MNNYDDSSNNVTNDNHKNDNNDKNDNKAIIHQMRELIFLKYKNIYEFYNEKINNSTLKTEFFTSLSQAYQNVLKYTEEYQVSLEFVRQRNLIQLDSIFDFIKTTK